MYKVQFFTRKNCKLCDEAYVLLELLQNEYDFQIETKDIETNEKLLEKYQVIIPVIKIGDVVLNNNMIDLEIIDQTLKRYVSK